MSARLRCLVAARRARVHPTAMDASRALAPSAAESAVAPYELEQAQVRAVLHDRAYDAAFRAAYRAVATELLGAEQTDPRPDEQIWSAAAVDAAVDAAGRAHAGVMLHRFVERSVGTSSLNLLARLLPAADRGRWLREWIGEAATLPGRRAQSRFAWQTVRGLPELAWTLWFPETAERRR